MKYRDSYVEDEKTLGDSGSITIPLTFKDVCTQLILSFKATNGATSNKKDPIIGCISKIEIVDGSDVLFSLSGKEAQALNYVNHGKVPYRGVTEAGGDSQRDIVHIDFGRYVGDPLWAFDPTKFKNPQLKITWDLATIQTVGGTGFLSTYLRLTVIARLFDDPVSPVGFFMSKEHNTFTSAASGVEPVDMPRDHPYRTLLVRAYLADTHPASIITKYKLSEDLDKRIPFDMHVRDLQQQMYESHEPASYEIEFLIKTLDVMYHDVYAPLAVKLTASVGAGKYRTVNQGLGWGGQTDFHCGRAGEDDIPTDERWIGEITGWYFHACAFKLFGDPQNPETWYDATKPGDIKLKLTQGTISGAVAVCIQQARKY